MKRFNLRTICIISIALLCVGCVSTPKVTHFYTDQSNSFVEVIQSVTDAKPSITKNIIITTNPESNGQTVEGFGACFNELGWTSLSRLTEQERADIFNELFTPNNAANFSICRMPLGANDFSLDWYSYNETDGDFEMASFSIENDHKTLIPFIKTALKYQPNLKIWASPWCPPTWMKYNKHYASALSPEWIAKQYHNGLKPEQVGYEGTDMFVQDPKYLSAYAQYFKKFINSYKEQGIDIYAVMPQNEFNSAQTFPSCCWTANGLANFIGNYLGEAMNEVGVDILFGTMERENYLMVDTILQDAAASKYIKGAGFQWAGKGAIGDVYKKYPELPLYQTEQECGNGKNDWEGLLHSWGLLKHFFDNGVSVYDYWNISLDEGGISRWGWAQNSLIVVNPENSTYRFTYEYYLMKHISHFVEKGAKYLKASGDANEFIAFKNNDGSIVVLFIEKDGVDKTLNIAIDGKATSVNIKANSINTIKI